MRIKRIANCNMPFFVVCVLLLLSGCKTTQKDDNLSTIKSHLEYANGVLVDSCLLINGKINGLRMSFHQDKRIIAYSSYLNNVRFGPVYEKFEGRLSVLGQCFNDKQIGPWYYYWPNGRVHRLSMFDYNGLLTETFQFDSLGRQVSPPILESFYDRNSKEFVIQNKNLPGADLYLIHENDSIFLPKYEHRRIIPYVDSDTLKGFYELEGHILPILFHVNYCR